MYTLSLHARQRQEERQVDDESMAAALAGRVVERDGGTYHYDNHSRTLLIAVDSHVVTIYKAHKKTVKRLLSR
jgi:hypothetical protein